MLDLAQPKDAHIEQRLRSELIIWLSTVRPDGRPHLVPVWFLWDGATFLIFSQPKDLKLRNLRHNPDVVLALETRDQGNEVVLIEGRNRQIRRMFEEVGHHVEKIKRLQLGPLVLDVEPGKFRELKEREIEELRRAANESKGGK